MKAREWQPGDVAMVTAYNHPEPYRAYYDGRDETWRKCDSTSFCVDRPTSVRRLVVIDYEDTEAVARLDSIYQRALDDAPEFHSLADIMQAALREFADPKPPKPEEPTGLGAVVETTNTRLWTHFGNGCWIKDVPNAQLETRDWSQLDVVRVVSEGVTP